MRRWLHCSPRSRPSSICTGAPPSSVRAGLIPCGGVVRPVAASRVLLVGDAAGMVSPVTAGGIHTALKHGLAAGNAVADFLRGKGDDPAEQFVRSYPKFRTKRLLRWLFDRFQTDFAFNWLLATRPDARGGRHGLLPSQGRVRPDRAVATAGSAERLARRRAAGKWLHQ